VFNTHYHSEATISCSIVIISILGFHHYDKTSLPAWATFRYKGDKQEVKTNHNKNFWVYSSLENKDIKKIIFRKLQDTVYVCHVGVPLWGTNIWRPSKSVQEMRQLIKSTFIVFLQAYGDYILLDYHDTWKLESNKHICFVTFLRILCFELPWIWTTFKLFYL